MQKTLHDSNHTTIIKGEKWERCHSLSSKSKSKTATCKGLLRMMWAFFEVAIFHTENWFLSRGLISLGGRMNNSDSDEHTDTGEAAMKHWWCLFAGNQTLTASSLASLPKETWVQGSWEQGRVRWGSDGPSHTPVRLWNDLVSYCTCTWNSPTPLSALRDCMRANSRDNGVMGRRLLHWLSFQIANWGGLLCIQVENVTVPMYRLHLVLFSLWSMSKWMFKGHRWGKMFYNNGLHSVCQFSILCFYFTQLHFPESVQK